MGIILTMTMVMITSMAIVRERERGTLEQLIVTPQSMGADARQNHTLCFCRICPGDGRAARRHFGIRSTHPRQSWSVIWLTSSFIFASLALGVLISTVTKTQMQAMQISFLYFLPSILLSGFMFPEKPCPYYLTLGNLLPLLFIWKLCAVLF